MHEKATSRQARNGFCCMECGVAAIGKEGKLSLLVSRPRPVSAAEPGQPPQRGVLPPACLAIYSGRPAARLSCTGAYLHHCWKTMPLKVEWKRRGKEVVAAEISATVSPCF